MQAAAVAHPNIALVKYWGKREAPGNRPAVPSLSITLDALRTETTVRFDPRLRSDSVAVNGRRDVAAAARITACLDTLRTRAGSRQWAHVETRNNFPTGAGLASSASGFAALVVAASRALGLDLSRRELSCIARKSSGSAARSLFGGFVEMPLAEDEEAAYPLLDGDRWPLSVVVAITATSPKTIGSTEGMRHTARTSDYYQAWLASAGTDFSAAREAVLAMDFPRLARVSEKSCLKMHGLMLSANPGLIYWNEASVACLHAIRELREQGVEVFFTMDAGPQVKAVCAPGDRERVAGALESIAGVHQVLCSGLGDGARVTGVTQ
ncbi:MAG: diphosphomevalonate decarboxylase [Arenicellales bacterium]